LKASRPCRKGTPQSWLQVKAAASIVRFVDSTFDEQKTDDQIRNLFVSVRGVAYRHMSLRASSSLWPNVPMEMEEET